MKKTLQVGQSNSRMSCAINRGYCGCIDVLEIACMVRDRGFIRREKPDSTTDSVICLRCYMTVGNGKDETALSVLELLHCCDSINVRFLTGLQGSE